MSDTIGTPGNPWKFDKEVYWDRRRKGYSGYPPIPGTPEHRHEMRTLTRKLKEAGITEEQFLNTVRKEGGNATKRRSKKEMASDNGK